MSPATLAGLSATMDRTELAERAGIDLRLLSVILHRAEAMRLNGQNTFDRTLRLAQSIADGTTCPDCFGVGRKHGNVYACGCDEPPSVRCDRCCKHVYARDAVVSFDAAYCKPCHDLYDAMDRAWARLGVKP